jgi:hypothetical protein
MLSRPWWQKDPGGPFTQSRMVDAPSDADRKLMASLTIRLEAGTYRFEGFR